MKISVFFSAPVPARSRPSAAAVRRAARKALGRAAVVDGELNIVFVDDREIRRLNREFLGKDRVTDVIAFAHPRQPLPGIAAPFGDIFVCVGRAAEQAAELGHGLRYELFMLAAHGALHLAGFDDDTPARRRAMNGRAEKIIGEFVSKEDE